MQSENDGTIGLDFYVVRDGAVIDGRDLAQSLMSMAYRLLIPYAQSCPACANALFDTLAKEVVGELKAGLEGGDLTGSYYVVEGDEEEQQAAFEAHRLATKQRTDFLIEQSAVSDETPHLVH